MPKVGRNRSRSVWGAVQSGTSQRELFYRNGNKMIVVEISTSPRLRLSVPHVLFEQRCAFGSAATIANYDVTQDGQRFLADISDLMSFDRSHPTPTRARLGPGFLPVWISHRKTRPAARIVTRDTNATDILTDTSPAFRPLLAHGLRQRTQVSRSARAAP